MENVTLTPKEQSRLQVLNSLAKSRRSSIWMSGWFGSMKSRNCLVVNWNRVESLQYRSRGAIIVTIGNNELPRHCS